MSLAKTVVYAAAAAGLGYFVVAEGYVERFMTTVAVSGVADEAMEKAQNLKKSLPTSDSRKTSTQQSGSHRVGLRKAVLKAGRGGHFETRAYVNGRPITVLADTGATLVSLNFDDARRVGLNPSKLDYRCCSQTANGPKEIALVTLDTVEIGHIKVRNVRAAVSERGAMSVNLLGMSFIGQLSKFEVAGNELILEQ